MAARNVGSLPCSDAWNLLHLARMLEDAGGLPAYGNVRTAWDTGTRYGLHNPEYR